MYSGTSDAVSRPESVRPPARKSRGKCPSPKSGATIKLARTGPKRFCQRAVRNDIQPVSSQREIIRKETEAPRSEKRGQKEDPARDVEEDEERGRGMLRDSRLERRYEGRLSRCDHERVPQAADSVGAPSPYSGDQARKHTTFLR